MKRAYPEEKAYEIACRLLSRRAHSEEEIRKKLSKKGINLAVINDVIERLKERGYLNDKELAKEWTLSLIKRRLWGKKRIEYFLSQRGISQDIIDELLKDILKDLDEEKIAKDALQKWFSYKHSKKDKAKQARFLYQRGFSWDTIYKIINESI